MPRRSPRIGTLMRWERRWAGPVAGGFLLLTLAVTLGAAPRRAETRDDRQPLEPTDVSVDHRDACSWQPGFAAPDLDHVAMDMVVFDDGTGPALYAGGYFSIAGGAPVNGIARWDGSAWSPLSGAAGTGVVGSVDALAVWDDGTGPALYLGGDFDVAGGVQVHNIARWDGASWSPLSGPAGTGMGSEFPRTVSALGVFDDGFGPALYAGGSFNFAGGLLSTGIAAWRCGLSTVFIDGFDDGTTTAWGFTIP